MLILIFFFKQKTAYEMRISDWSSDGCSSELESSSRSPPSSVCDAGCCAAGQPCAADPCGRRFDYHAHPRAQHPGGDGLPGEARGRWAQRTLGTGGGDAGSVYQLTRDATHGWFRTVLRHEQRTSLLRRPRAPGL